MWTDLIKERKCFSLPQCNFKFTLIIQCHVSLNLVTPTKKENEKDLGQKDLNQAQGNKRGAVTSWLLHSTRNQVV